MAGFDVGKPVDLSVYCVRDAAARALPEDWDFDEKQEYLNNCIRAWADVRVTELLAVSPVVPLLRECLGKKRVTTSELSSKLCALSLGPLDVLLVARFVLGCWGKSSRYLNALRGQGGCRLYWQYRWYGGSTTMTPEETLRRNMIGHWAATSVVDARITGTLRSWNSV